MARHSESQTVASPLRRIATADANVERELLQAMEDFERGDYVELTIEQLEHCAATGESPWPDESPG
jgi:hypothetical protein